MGVEAEALVAEVDDWFLGLCTRFARAAIYRPPEELLAWE